jgi:hypothetical protein
MTELFCELCNKTYASEKTFNAHLKKSFKHLGNNPYTCNYCNKSFAHSSSLNYHKEICKYKLDKEAEDKIEQMSKEKEELLLLLQKKEEECIKLKETNQSCFEKIKNLEEQVIQLNFSLEKKNVALETTKIVMKEMKPNTTNNIYNNKTFIQTIANNLIPIRDDEIRETVDKLSIHHFKQGPKGVVKFVTTDYLAPRVVCTDASRHTTVWKDENKEIIHDNGSRKLSEKVSTIIGEKDYKPMLDAFNQIIDQTCPDDIISINTAYDSVKQFQNNKQTALDELARGISKGAKTIKQITNGKQNFISLQQNLKRFVEKSVHSIVLNGMEGVFKTLIQHFKENDSELLKHIEDIKEGKVMWFSSKESETSYFLDDSGDLIIDKYHECLVKQICIFCVQIKDCSPFGFETSIYKDLIETSSNWCELYQECL